jgi:hypothetical protein
MYLRKEVMPLPSWLNWRRRSVRDAIVIVSGLISAFVFLDLGDAFLGLADLAKKYEGWGADDAFFLSFLLSVSLVVFSVRDSRTFPRD